MRLCIPQFRSISMQLFDLRAMVLCVFNSILPGKINHRFINTLIDTLVQSVFFMLFFFLFQEFWFSSWDSLPFYTAGSMLLLRCFALQTGCFTRCCPHSHCKILGEKKQNLRVYMMFDFILHAPDRIGGIQPLLPIITELGM